jgi:hypothetical protein
VCVGFVKRQKNVLLLVVGICGVGQLSATCVVRMCVKWGSNIETNPPALPYVCRLPYFACPHPRPVYFSQLSNVTCESYSDHPFAHSAFLPSIYPRCYSRNTAPLLPSPPLPSFCQKKYPHIPIPAAPFPLQPPALFSFSFLILPCAFPHVLPPLSAAGGRVLRSPAVANFVPSPAVPLCLILCCSWPGS